MKEDLPTEIEKRAQMIYPIVQAAKKMGHKATVIKDKLLLNGEWFNHLTIRPY